MHGSAWRDASLNGENQLESAMPKRQFGKSVFDLRVPADNLAALLHGTDNFHTTEVHLR
jgi:hypothetical protein